MENDVNGWLSFAGKVEESLQTINGEFFSNQYRDGLSNLVNRIREEASCNRNLSPIEKQESFLRLNTLGQELREAAYFMFVDALDN